MNKLAVLPAEGPGGIDAGTRIGNPLLPDNLQNLSGAEFVSELISTGVTLILVIGAILFFIMLLAGGLGWILSGGDKGSVETARNRITHALVGLVLLFSVFAIIKVVEAIFGISILAIDITPLILGN